MTTEAKMIVNADVRAILRDSALASAKASAELMAASDKAKGAYSMAVDAAILAKSATVLEAAYDDLFEEIRKTGKLKAANGKAVPVGAKANKDGSGYRVPSAISSAKSYMLEALTRAIPLTDDDGKARAFSAIRSDVMVAKDHERRETATGDEALRIAGLDMLAALEKAVRESEGAKLAAIVRRITEATASPKADTKAEQIAQAA